MELIKEILRIKEVMGINEESKKPTHALIEVLPALAHMDEKYRYQVVPYHTTKEDKIYIKKGSAGNKSISTKNIKLIKTGSEEEMRKRLSKIEDELLKKDNLSESSMPLEVKRRINFLDDKIVNNKIVNKLKDWVMRKYESGKKEKTLIKAFYEVTYYILNSAASENDYDDEIFEKVRKYLVDKYMDQMSRFYDETFSDDDYETYCFIKHSKRYGGLDSRGFSECIHGWNNFLSKYGFWLSHLDWNEIKKKLHDSPQNTPLLIANPLEGHNFEYYFSVVKK